MYCQKCKAEYREGFNKCSECQVDLVNELPKEPEQKLEHSAQESEYIEYVCLLTTFNPADVAIIKSILDGTDIQYFFKDEILANVRPLADPTRLMIDKHQIEDTKELLKDLKLNWAGINIDLNKNKK